MGFPHGSDSIRICLQCRRHWFHPWVRRFLGEGNGNPLHYSCLGNPMDRRTWQTTGHGVVVGRGGLPLKEWALVLHSEKYCLRRHVLTKQETLLEEGTREGNGTPFQYSCLENPTDRGAWQATVHRVAWRQTLLK